MRILENAKFYFGERVIKAYLRTAKREVKSRNISDCKTIGILFNATHQISFEIVKNFVKSLSGKKAAIDVLGYVDSKQLIDHYLYRKGFEFFTHKQLNWFYKPVTENTKAFISKPFDLLINLSLDELYPIQYILACSKAKFKAGLFSENQHYLDFMIDIGKEKEAMSKLKLELQKDLKQRKKGNKEVEKIVDKKVQTEIQLNFLINQLIHYLSKIKN